MQELRSDGPHAVEERRVVTAVFADLCGSTQLSELMDPEDAHELIGEAVRRVITEVDTLGGTVKDLAGDGVLALFGAPRAHEDDAERAVLCALRIVASMAESRTGQDDDGLQVRVGVETGLAATGLIGGGSRMEYGATGDVVNTAARLQAVADPGSVLVGQATRRLVEDRFRWGEPRSYDLKGKAAPVHASPTLAHLGRAPTVTQPWSPCVGRDQELATLRQTMREVTSGRGALVAIMAEGGMGKTRVLDELRGRTGEEVLWLQTQAQSYGDGVPYLPFRHLFLRLLGVPLDAPPGDVRAALARVADPDRDVVTAGLVDVAPLLLAGAEAPRGDPRELQRRILTAVETWFIRVADSHPVLLVLEDLHWADASSVALLERLASRCPGHRAGVLVTSRPEPEALDVIGRLTAGGPHLTRVSLSALDPSTSAGLLNRLIGDAQRARDFTLRVLDASGGNPLYLEQLAREVADNRHGSSTQRNEDRLLPLSLQHLLVARIDKLPPGDRDVLSAASVLGSRISLSLLRDVLGRQVAATVSRLVAEGFLSATTEGDTAEFRHSLIEDATYLTLSRSRRRLLHGMAAQALASAYAGREDDVAALLGRHLAESGAVDAALPYFLTAARQAAAAFANTEAAKWSGDALRLVGATESDDKASLEPPRETLVIDLLMNHAEALAYLGNYDEAADTVRRALALRSSADDRARLHWMLARCLKDGCHYDEALLEYDRAASLVAPDAIHDDLVVDIAIGRANVAYWRGDMAGAVAVLEESRSVVERRASPQRRAQYDESLLTSRFGLQRFRADPALLTLAAKVYASKLQHGGRRDQAWGLFTYGSCLLCGDRLDDAQKCLLQALEDARTTEDAQLEARALTYYTVAARLRRDETAVQELDQRVVEAARVAGLGQYEAVAVGNRAWLSMLAGDMARARAEAEAALTMWASSPTYFPYQWIALIPLIAALVAQGKAPDAVAAVHALLDTRMQALPEVVQAAAESVLHLPNSDNATLTTGLHGLLIAAQSTGMA